LRYQSRTQIPSATSPTTVLAYCKVMYVGIGPSSGTLTQRCSQAQRHPGQENGWVNASQTTCVAMPSARENKIAAKRAGPPNLNSPSWPGNLCCMPPGSKVTAGRLMAARNSHRPKREGGGGNEIGP